MIICDDHLRLQIWHWDRLNPVQILQVSQVTVTCVGPVDLGPNRTWDHLRAIENCNHPALDVGGFNMF